MSVSTSVMPKIWVSECRDSNQLTAGEKQSIGAITEKVFGAANHVVMRRLLERANVVACLCLKETSGAPDLLGYVIALRKVTIVNVVYLAITPIAKKQYRRQGYGTQLMKKIFEFAVRENLSVTLSYNCLRWKTCAFCASFTPTINNNSSWFRSLLWPHRAQPIFDPKISLETIDNRTSESAGPSIQARYVGTSAGTEFWLMKNVYLLVMMSICALFIKIICEKGSELLDR